MVSIFYAGLAAISVFYLVLLYMFFAEHVSFNYVILNVAIILVCLGYWRMSIATTVEGAVVANQVVYFGAAFTSYLILLCIADLCKEEIPVVVKVLGMGVASFIVVCVMTSTDSGWYYRSVGIDRSQGYTVFLKEYGPLHVIYPIYLLTMMGYGILLIIKTLRQLRKVSYITSTILLLNMIFITGLYFAERFFDSKIELLPLAYIVGFGWVIVILRKIRHYDIAGLSQEVIQDANEAGWLIIDHKGRFAAADEVARSWFKELDHLDIDRKIVNFNTDFLMQIEKWIGFNPETREKVVHIEREGRIIEVTHSMTKRAHHAEVHCIGLRDDTKQQQYLQLMEEYSDKLEEEVEKKTEKIRAIQDDITVSMASIVENRDNNTGGHVRRTSDVVKIFVDYLQEKNVYSDILDSKMARCIIKAAPLHDFGKIAIPDDILNKKGKFEPWEYEKMKQHSVKGSVIVRQILQSSEDEQFKQVAVNVAHYHHEKWDGKGYPEGKKELDIPFEARVMALADVFDALVSKRVYKEQFSYDKAFDIISESNGSHFDPELCGLFLECRPKLEALYDSYDD